LNCEETCECQKGTTKACDPVTGECLCHTGYRGVRCETQCPKGRYGPECREVCHCENDGSCDKLGDCFCQRGWTGELCEERCPTGTFIIQMEFIKSFAYLFFCRLEGFYGKKCRQPCPSCVNGTFVINQVSAYYFSSIYWFFLFDFFFKVTAIVIQLTVVVLVSPVTWEYDARSHVLKVFNYLACLMDRLRHLISYTLCLSGTYGDGCQQKCNRCKNGAECHHVTGWFSH
jgi:hypothetical protein